MKQNKNLKAKALNILSYVIIMVPALLSILFIVLPGILVDMGHHDLVVKYGPWMVILAVFSLAILFPIGACIGSKLIEKSYKIEHNL